jgi:guanine deaminase
MRLYRGRIFTPLRDPFEWRDEEVPYAWFDDGFVAVTGEGRIAAIGPWADRPSSADATEELDRRMLITPGLIDTHLHAPQLEMIGSYGGHLLEWLERYTFPTEAKFADPEHARVVAGHFFDELLRNGTTTSLIFSTVHTEATDLLFAEAERRGVRAIIGKAMMDRNAPAELLEDPATAYTEAKKLISKWHRRGLLAYAVSPRFAPACSPELLEVAGKLVAEGDDLYVHTHVAENLAETAWVRALFPDARDYVDVYARHGLLGPRSVLAHGIHLSDRELRALDEAGSRIAHCPNSNLFLGSGLFPLGRVREAGLTVGLGTDIGAGTTPSMFSAMADAYKVQQVQGVSVTPFQLWYLATLGGAKTLSLDHRTGSLEQGKDADFLVLDTRATPLLGNRTATASTAQDTLAGLIFMGDDRLVRRAFVQGREVFSRPAGA